MNKALLEAKKAYKKDEVPIGCVIVKDGDIISYGHNLRESKKSGIWHAEMVAIDKACKKLGSWNLSGCDLYVTIEPCPMCAGAILQSRISNVYYGAKEPKAGAITSIMKMYDYKGFNHYPKVYGGILEDDCKKIMKDYFKSKRNKK